MQVIDIQKARSILINREKLKPFLADLILKDYPALEDALAAAVEQWLASGTFDNIEVEGLTIKQVMQLRRSNFMVAVKELNRLLDPALSAETRNRLRDILNKPVILE
jgi:hypothetical protein